MKTRPSFVSHIRVVFAALLLAGLPMSDLLRAEDAPKPAQGWSVTPLLPADTLAVVTVVNSKQSLEQFQQTGLWNIYNNPDVQRAFQGPLSAAQMAIFFAETQGGFKLKPILNYFSQGEITLALLGVEKKADAGRNIPDLLLSIQARDQIGPMMDELNKRLDQLKAAAAGQLGTVQVPVGNMVVNKVVLQGLPMGPLTVNYAQCDGNLLLTFGEGRLERLLAMREKFKDAAPKPVDGQQPEVLAQDPAYQKVLQKMGPDMTLLAYLNVAALVKNPVFEALPKTDQQKREWQAAGLDGIRALAYGNAIKDKGIRETFYIDAPAATRRGLLTLAEGAGVPPEALFVAPRNSLVAAAVRVSPETVLDRLLEIAAIQDPNARQQADAALVALGQQLKIDVKKELLSALTGQATFSLAMIAHHPKLPLAFPQPLLTMGIKDVAALKNVLAAVRNTMKDNNFDFAESPIGETEIVTARERFAEGRDPGQICYAIDKKDIVFSLYPLALREELARRGGTASMDPAKSTAATLADDPDFKAARACLSSQPQAMLYIDTGALAVAAYDILVPVAQLRERNAQVDIAALPTSDVLLKNLGGTVFGFSSDPDGIIAEGYSPTGALSVLAIGGTAAVRQWRMNRGQQGMGGGPEAQRAKQIGEQIARDLKAYAAENNGNLPAAIKDLQPKYLQDVGPDVLDNVVYRGKQDAANKVVAHSSEKVPGPITIVLQDGAVAQIQRSLLGKVLTEGYTPPPPGAGRNRRGPATNQTPVKPPKPPEF
ncbi:MAG TPA: DUF3352 domain-containing protein [Planctomycetota bacterium]